MAPRRNLGTLPRLAIVAIAVAMLLGLAIAVAFDKLVLGIEIALLASAPLFLYWAYRRPTIFPLGLYILSVPVDPLLKVGSGAGSTLTKYIGIATIAALLVHAFRMRRLYAPPRAWYGWAAYLLLCTLSIAWSIDGEVTTEFVLTMCTLFALYTAIAMYPMTAQAYVTVRRTAVLAGALTALYGFYAYVGGQRMNGARLSLAQGDIHLDPNHYSAFFCIPIGIVAARLFFTRSRRDQVVCALLVLIMFTNVLLSGSRGGLIAATLLTLYIGIRARRYVLLGITFLAGLAFTFAVPNVWQRILDPTQGDASGRSEIWSVGIAAIKEYGLIGCGFGAFPVAYQENLNHAYQRLFSGYGRPAHNIMIQTTAELGIAGLIILCAAWWASFRQNAFIPRTSPYFMDRCAFEGAIMGIFVSALTIDLLWFKYFWLCLTLIAILSNVVRPTILFGRPIAMPRRQAARPAGAVRAPVRL